jgi:hypothetical protein
MNSDARLVAPGATLGVKFRYLAQSPVTAARQSHRGCHSPQLAGNGLKGSFQEPCSFSCNHTLIRD